MKNLRPRAACSAAGQAFKAAESSVELGLATMNAVAGTAA